MYNFVLLTHTSCRTHAHSLVQYFVIIIIIIIIISLVNALFFSFSMYVFCQILFDFKIQKLLQTLKLFNESFYSNGEEEDREKLKK